MLRTGQLLGPAPHPASRPRTGALLPGTLASPRTGLSPAGCPQLVDWLRHHNINLLVVMAPNLLDAPPVRREGESPRRDVHLAPRDSSRKRHGDQGTPTRRAIHLAPAAELVL